MNTLSPKSISYWAKSNRGKAIALLLFVQAILFALCFLNGVLIFVKGYTFSATGNWLGFSLFLLACICYPFKGVKSGFFKYSFKKKKFWQGVVLFSTLILFTNTGNQFACSSMMNNAVQEAEAINVVLGLKKDKRINIKPSRKERSVHKKNLKRKLRSAIKKIKKLDKLETDYIILGIILSLLLTVVLGFGVLYLYCGLACSGNGTAALAVLAGGIILYSFLMVGIWRSMKKRSLERKEYKKSD